MISDEAQILLVMGELNWPEGIRSMSSGWNVSSFQKTVYLLQNLGLKTGYTFRWYGHVASSGLHDVCHEAYYAELYYIKEIGGASYKQGVKEKIFGKFKELFSDELKNPGSYEVHDWLTLVSSVSHVVNVHHLYDRDKIKPKLYDKFSHNDSLFKEANQHLEKPEYVDKAVDMVLENFIENEGIDIVLKNLAKSGISGFPYDPRNIENNYSFLEYKLGLTYEEMKSAVNILIQDSNVVRKTYELLKNLGFDELVKSRLLEVETFK